VKVKQTGKSWVIVDDNKEYLVQKVNQALSVYFRKKHPREEIRAELEAKLQDSFSVGNSVGAKILKVELGEIKVRDFKDIGAPEEVYDQLVDVLQADWERRVIEDQIRGEAELAHSQAAQVRARAEMALNLTEAIRPLVANERNVSSYLLAARFIETLRWMVNDPFKRTFRSPEVMQVLNDVENELRRAKHMTEVEVSSWDTSDISLKQLLQRRQE
jgi:hypothetical protein